MPTSQPLMYSLFQSTPSAWRETSNLPSSQEEHNISIHSLRMEGDLGGWRSPCACSPFQSTPSAWRETKVAAYVSIICRYFNPLPPHGGRLHAADFIEVMLTISIHSLRMEGDSRDSALLLLSAISIHSLRMEGDGNSQTFGEWLEDFNPLPPHGGRQLEYARPAVEENFNPLPPHGGRPIGKAVGDDVPDISIHSLRMEGDATLKHNWGISRYFNPLPPHGGRLVAGHRRTHVARHFNPLPPHGGRQRV